MTYAVGATYGAGGFHAVVVDRADTSRRVRLAGPFEVRADAIEWAARALRQVEILARLELSGAAVHPDDSDDEPDDALANQLAALAIPHLISTARDGGPLGERARREFVRRLENLDSDCFLQARFEGAAVPEARRFAFEALGRTADEVVARALCGALDDSEIASRARVREWLRERADASA